MRKIDTIILHCSATKEGKEFDVLDIKKWHLERGFKDVGYHYVIKLDGTIQKGRDDNTIGAHASGYNKGSIGICYIGGLDHNDKPKDTRTLNQTRSLQHLVKILMHKYNIKPHNVIGHNEVSTKDCPCFNVRLEHFLCQNSYEREQGLKIFKQKRQDIFDEIKDKNKQVEVIIPNDNDNNKDKNNDKKDNNSSKKDEQPQDKNTKNNRKNKRNANKIKKNDNGNFIIDL